MFTVLVMSVDAPVAMLVMFVQRVVALHVVTVAGLVLLLDVLCVLVLHLVRELVLGVRLKQHSELVLSYVRLVLHDECVYVLWGCVLHGVPRGGGGGGGRRAAGGGRGSRAAPRSVRSTRGGARVRDGRHYHHYRHYHPPAGWLR